jgi:solute carrier family 32 (vesicular inhibitory amino acid transporter)
MKGIRHYLFTKEDAIAAFNLFCGVCGIGTLGMPANFARASPLFGIIAMVFMGFANVYASVVVSKTMLQAPRSVKTFGDLGEWVMGRFGRYLVVAAQMAVCFLTAAAFLVLGGNMLSSLFPKAFSEVFWIVFMALMVLPVSLTPTMKEGAGAAFAGCMGTIIADICGVGILIHAMDGHPSVPKPDISLEQIATTFGNLALAYGGAVVIPTIQRQHRQPDRMPWVIGVTLTFITCMFIALAWSGYSAVGCQISGNLLFSVFPDAEGFSTIGFKSSFGTATIAYLFMQLHITIAFAVFLHPAFYILERLVLGMHKVESDDLVVDGAAYHGGETPQEVIKRSSSAAWSVKSNSMLEGVDNEEAEIESAEYKGAGTVLKYVGLRMVVIALLVILAVVLRKKFVDLSDFIGACANTILCILIPIAFYLKKFGMTLPMYERVAAVATFVICAVLGAYVTYKSGKALVETDHSGIKFPFCKAEHQMELYYVKP